MMHFKTVSEIDQAGGFPKPENPLFSINRLTTNLSFMGRYEFICDFYLISLKKVKSGNIMYGRTKYDTDNGSMQFMKPRQIVIVENLQWVDEGFIIHLHEDYLIGHPLFNDIKKYDYFDYNVNESLHLTTQEEETIWLLVHKIEKEYHNNTDEFSKSIILSHLDSMLRYAQRFYKRQFIDRKPLLGTTVTKFNKLLIEYFEKGTAESIGLPNVNYMAAQLNLSTKYLTDLLKQETGKTALELIHLYLISQAKNMLVTGDQSISEIAYQLGFENPPYFSRLFKREVGMSPREFQNHLMN